MDAEMERAIDLPGRSLLEIVQLKARSRPDAAWSRLNRGESNPKGLREWEPLLYRPRWLELANPNPKP